MTRQTRSAPVRALLASAVLAIAGCAEDQSEAAKPNRGQIRAVVIGFYTDVVEGDVEGACDKLTGAGRAQAIGRPRAIGKPRRPVSEEQCRTTHIGLRDSTELPGIIENDLLRISRITISGDRARAITTAATYDGVQRLRHTGEGWKLDAFDAMVHH